MATQSSFIDPHALMSIRNMELRARVVVEGFLNGLHRSPYHGFSVEFTEYRQYTAGDDTRFVDWRLVGRTDRYYIKKFEDETNLRCFFLVDQSHSMSFGSEGYSKTQYAATLAATLGYFLERQGDAIGLLTFAEAMREYLPARHRPGHLRQFMVTLEKQTSGKITNLEAPLIRAAELIRKRGLLIVLSDFFGSLENLEKSLGQLRAWGHEVTLFQTLDAAEIALEMDKPSLFRDMESGRELYIDPKLARRGYLDRLKTHNETLQQIARKLGVAHHLVPTNRPLEKSLLEFLLDRRKLGKSLRRSRAD
ncbi:MAG TPA: DUF58 domain-containing protein [Verrucomicrobiae bacterium]|jgi:uncharacterized protein (DUF58 family)|nr:DUF58 domain-containing protein [Verrucomicrobiae bacterium]